MSTLTVWFCTFCREDVQIGAAPDKCCGCGDGQSLTPIEVPYAPPTPWSDPNHDILGDINAFAAAEYGKRPGAPSHMCMPASHAEPGADEYTCHCGQKWLLTETGLGAKWEKTP